MRYKLKGNPAWCLNWKNGWIRFGDWIFRWNTKWMPSKEYEMFSFTKMARRETA